MTLNRNPELAQTVVDTCLYLVRALADIGEDRNAVAQARECVRFVPGGTPTRQMHPPVVLELYEAAAAPNPDRSSTLLVENEPSECAGRLNGIRVGDTPFEARDLYPGTYRVQVECELSSPIGLKMSAELRGT